MALRIGIIGLPNVGKSTVFNALTKLDVPALNYPFCTIEPNQGMVLIPDERLEKIAEVSQPKTLTGSTIEFVDIAGLVKGASRGEGLGNQFLAHIREMDALAHVVRLFQADDVASQEQGIDPLRDIEIVDLELILADLQTLERRRERTTRMLKTGEPQYRKELELLDQYQAALETGVPLRRTDLPPLADLPLLSAKPVMYVANTDEGDYGLAPDFKEWAASEGAEIVVMAADFEMELSRLDQEDAELFLAEANMDKPALHRLVEAGVRLLDLITFYTIKGDETRSWIISRGMLAPQAAGCIHSDMERGFIRAEVINWKILVDEGSLAGCRDKGLLRIEGKDYAVQDGDVIFFRFNV
ncbi:MAG: redox-regulated ATPase YchF [Bacillota bacterium]|jgi:GTP-binding protein YchF|nr:redox-regulated ATPase YchF [Bacillota bacterium]NLJ02793.1 redox-regulated ATPase YchF [Bacillota bacterium]